MKIALLIPSRERVDKKIELMNSIENTVSDINNICLYFGIDDDDPSREYVKEIVKDKKYVRIVEIHNDGKFLGLGRLWNICANEAKEEILAMVGDDMVFMTKGWDKEIIDEFSERNCPSDKIKMVYCYDGRHGQKIAVNAFVHRAYMELNGYLMREEFKVDFIDIWLQQIFTALGRIKYRGDIHIEHMHWSFKKSVKDGVSRNLRGNGYPESSQKLWIETKEERVKEVMFIASEIGVFADIEKINSRIPG